MSDLYCIKCSVVTHVMDRVFYGEKIFHKECYKIYSKTYNYDKNRCSICNIKDIYLDENSNCLLCKNKKRCEICGRYRSSLAYCCTCTKFQCVACQLDKNACYPTIIPMELKKIFPSVLASIIADYAPQKCKFVDSEIYPVCQIPHCRNQKLEKYTEIYCSPCKWVKEQEKNKEYYMTLKCVTI